MSDIQKTATAHFEADIEVVNEPFAKAELFAAMKMFCLAVRNIDGGDVFRIKGTTPIAARGSADFSGWTDAPLEFAGDLDAPFPFFDQEHPAPAVNPADVATS